MYIKDVLIFSEFDSSGGTREFLKQLIVINNKLNINSFVVSEYIDDEMISFFYEQNVKFSCIKKRNNVFHKPYFSIIHEFIYHRSFVNNIKHDLVISSVGTPGINFFHFLTKSKYLYILHTVPNKPGLKSFLHYLIPYIFQGTRNNFYVVSNYLKNAVSSLWKINLDNISVIYNSYRFEKLHTEVLKSNKLTLFTIGHVSHYRDPESWLKIAIYFSLKYDYLKFIWVGEGPLLESLRNRVPENLDISFIGKTDHVEKYYREGDIYLNFSNVESLGMAVVDAISFGIPCVVRKVGGLPEIIEHEFNGYTFVNFEEAVLYIDNLICNSELRVTMGQNSICHKKIFFAPETQLGLINSLYENILF